MNYLLYFSYGKGPHVTEARYSIISARQALEKSGGECKIVVYSDDLDARFGDDVSIRFITQEELTAWTGTDGYLHRRKLCVLRDALKTLGGPVAFVDSDTYFRKSPIGLFDRIGPGRSVLHRKEGHLDKWHASSFADHIASIPAPVSLSGVPWQFTCDSPMWNSGVIGMHPADVSLTDEILHLIDQLLEPVLLRFHGTEQFCTGAVLRERTNLSESMDIVYHYWLMERRRPFRSAIEDAFAQGMTDTEIHRKLASIQPADSVVEVGKLRVKRLLESTGLYSERRRA